jgi:hypothetical protein
MEYVFLLSSPIEKGYGSVGYAYILVLVTIVLNAPLIILCLIIGKTPVTINDGHNSG